MYSLEETIKRQEMLLSHPRATSYNQPPEVRRRRQEPLDKYRNVFQVDKERIITSKAYRRLKHKTQVIWAPRNAHFRTRMTHTQEVAQAAYTISSLLGLNTDLTLAIAYAHDVGQPPFGHAGERALKKYLQKKVKPPQVFDHHRQAVKILQEQEKFPIGPNDYVRGLNLTWQVEDGLLHCSVSSHALAKTLEAQVVAFADDITYILHDFEEFRTMGVLHSDEFIEIARSLGVTYQEKLNRAIQDICKNSNDREVKMSDELMTLINRIKEKTTEIFKSEDLWARRESGAEATVYDLLNYFLKESTDNVEKAIKTLISPREEKLTIIERIRGGEDRVEAYANYIARMTDTFALDLHRHLFSPETSNYFY